MSPIAEFLTTQWREHTVALLLLTSIISAFFGAGAKAVLEILLPQALKDRREARRLVARLSTPLLESASQLEGRIRNFAIYGKPSWMSDSGYYRLSSYYSAAQYFGWVHILFTGLDQLRIGSRRRDRRLTGTLHLVDKTFNNTGYFRFAWLGDAETGDSGDVPKFVCSAIGELMAGGEGRPIGFAEFCQRYREEASFRSWIDHLDRFFRKNERAALDPVNIRLRLVQLSLGGLMNVLGARSHFERMTVTRAAAVFEEIEDPFVRDLIAVDFCLVGTPVYPEGRRGYWRRRLPMLVRRDPHRLPRPETQVPAAIVPEPGAFDLADGRGRARFYEWVAGEAVQRTLRARKRMRFSLELQVDASRHSDSDVIRMAHNIEECSGRRILASHVKVTRSTPPADRGVVKVDAVAGVMAPAAPPAVPRS